MMFGRKKKKYKIGIALGGGGARGIAHLGVLQALKEKGIEPNIIAGVSAGAIAGAVLADGKSPKEALEIIKQYKFRDFTKFKIPRDGLLGLDNLTKAMDQHVSALRIEELETPLIIGVSNMLDGKIEYLSEGPLATSVQASAAIPVLFSPVELNGKLYSDGGLFENLPVRALREKCKTVIGVSISPVEKVEQLNGLVSVAARMFQLSVNSNHAQLKKECDVFIEPTELSKYDIMDTKHADEIYQIGYEHASKLDIRL